MFFYFKKITRNFKSFDLNNDGYISKTELINGLASIGIDINMSQAVDLINEYSTESVAIICTRYMKIWKVKVLSILQFID